MALAISLILPLKPHPIIKSNSSPLPSSISTLHCNLTSSVKSKSFSCSYKYPLLRNRIIIRRSPNFICRATEYKFPDPIPEFADAETEKFRANLIDKLSKREIFGDEVEEVVDVCTEIFSNFLHTEYGGPGTLMVDWFADMADALNEEGLPGGPQAARLAIKWAQNHVDKDWKEWTGIR